MKEEGGVETRRLNEQVRRNRRRFPADFVFRLTRGELENLMSPFATSKLMAPPEPKRGRRTGFVAGE